MGEVGFVEEDLVEKVRCLREDCRRNEGFVAED